MQKSNFNSRKIIQNKEKKKINEKELQEKVIKTHSPAKKDIQKKEIIKEKAIEKESSSIESYDENEYLNQIADNFTFLKFFFEERDEFEIIFNKERFKIKKDQLYDCLDFFITSESLFDFKAKMLQKEYLVIDKARKICPQNNTGYYALQVYTQFFDKNNSFWSEENLKHGKDDSYNNLFYLKLKLGIVKKGLQIHKDSKNIKFKELLSRLEKHCSNKLLNNNLYGEFDNIKIETIKQDVKKSRSEPKRAS